MIHDEMHEIGDCPGDGNYSSGNAADIGNIFYLTVVLDDECTYLQSDVLNLRHHV